MSLLEGVSRRRVCGLAALPLATLGISACCVGVSSAATGVIRTIPVAVGVDGVSSDGTDVWVTNNDGLLSEVEASTGTIIRTIRVGEEDTSVSSDGTHVWVFNSSENTVTEVEASSGDVIRTIRVGEPPIHGPIVIGAVSSDGTDVWVSHENTVSEIEASSGKVIRTITVNGQTFGVSSDGTHVWVTDNEDEVTEIEASSGKVIRTIPVGIDPVGVSSDGTHVWVANSDPDSPEGSVSEIEASSGNVIRTIPVDRDPESVSSDGTHVWVANTEEFKGEGSAGVSEIDASSGSVIRTITVGQFPIEVSSDGTHVWVSNYEEPEAPFTNGAITISEIRVAAAECSGNTGTITLAPGLTATAAVQKLTVKGTLVGCTGEPFTAASYTATMRTGGPVSCSVLNAEPAIVLGSASFKWTPRAKASSGALALLLGDDPESVMQGEVAAGSYAPLTFTDEPLSEIFSGGPQCGEPDGRKAAKPVKKGVFEGSTTLFDE